jgi:hypothetical protein
MASRATPDVTSVKVAIQRLTEISSDLSKMLAVHEQRLGQHEKKQDTLEFSIEKRRDELLAAIDRINKDIDTSLARLEADTKVRHTEVLEKIKAVDDYHNIEIVKLTNRISTFEKYVWMAIGAITVASWAVSLAISKAF